MAIIYWYEWEEYMAIKRISTRLNDISGYVNSVSFTWQMVGNVLKWFHGGGHHHSIDLTDDDVRTLQNGGKVECHYDCGNVLIAQK